MCNLSINIEVDHVPQQVTKSDISLIPSFIGAVCIVGVTDHNVYPSLYVDRSILNIDPKAICPFIGPFLDDTSAKQAYLTSTILKFGYWKLVILLTT